MPYQTNRNGLFRLHTFLVLPNFYSVALFSPSLSHYTLLIHSFKAHLRLVYNTLYIYTKSHMDMRSLATSYRRHRHIYIERICHINTHVFVCSREHFMNEEPAQPQPAPKYLSVRIPLGHLLKLYMYICVSCVSGSFPRWNSIFIAQEELHSCKQALNLDEIQNCTELSILLINSPWDARICMFATKFWSKVDSEFKHGITIIIMMAHEALCVSISIECQHNRNRT